MTETMLVALDHAGCAAEVADRAADIAARLGQRVVLLHVVVLPAGVPAEAAVHRWDPGHLDEDVTVLEGLTEDAVDALRAFAERFAARGVSTQIEVRQGEPSRAILTAAADHGASMITLGTHGRTGLSRMLQGSVAETVLRRAPCPVLTIRQSAPEAGPTSAQRHISAESEG